MLLCIYLLLPTAYALHPSSSRLSLALDALDRIPKDSRRRVVDACLDVIRAVPGTAPVDAARLRALADEEEDDAALSTRFFDAKPCDDAVRALARGDDEAAAAVAASARFALLPRAESRAQLALTQRIRRLGRLCVPAPPAPPRRLQRHDLEPAPEAAL